MTNDVMTVTSNLPTTHEAEVNNLLDATKDVFQKLLKFKKGKFYIQDDGCRSAPSTSPIQAS